MEREVQAAFSQPLEVVSCGKNQGVKALFLTLAGFEAFDFSGSVQLTEAEEANYRSETQKPEACGNTMGKNETYKRHALIKES